MKPEIGLFVDRLRLVIARLRGALAFARSVIKSGEPWSTTCDQVIDGALQAERHGTYGARKAVP
jgi:hypothetical protein